MPCYNVLLVDVLKLIIVDEVIMPVGLLYLLVDNKNTELN